MRRKQCVQDRLSLREVNNIYLEDELRKANKDNPGKEDFTKGSYLRLEYCLTFESMSVPKAKN